MGLCSLPFQMRILPWNQSEQPQAGAWSGAPEGRLSADSDSLPGSRLRTFLDTQTHLPSYGAARIEQGPAISISNQVVLHWYTNWQSDLCTSSVEGSFSQATRGCVKLTTKSTSTITKPSVVMKASHTITREAEAWGPSVQGQSELHSNSMPACTTAWDPVCRRPLLHST